MPEPSTFTKLFGLAKGLSLSALAAAIVTLVLFLSVPPLRNSVPPVWIPYFVFGAIFSEALFSIGIVGAMISLCYRINTPRLEHLYAPLYGLLLDTHITTPTGAGAPRFQDRWENALEKLTEIKSKRRAIRAAWRALFDKLRSSSSEVEYGKDLPRATIMDIIRQNPRYADTKLVVLARRMDRARYEDPHGANWLSEEDMALCDHIYAKYFRLKFWVTLLSRASTNS